MALRARASEKPWHQEHTADWMVILKSIKEELHRCFPLLDNTKYASHTLRWLRPSRNFYAWNRPTPQYTMTTNYALFEHDGVLILCIALKPAV